MLKTVAERIAMRSAMKNKLETVGGIGPENYGEIAGGAISKLLRHAYISRANLPGPWARLLMQIYLSQIISRFFCKASYFRKLPPGHIKREHNDGFLAIAQENSAQTRGYAAIHGGVDAPTAVKRHQWLAISAFTLRLLPSLRGIDWFDNDARRDADCMLRITLPRAPPVADES